MRPRHHQLAVIGGGAAGLAVSFGAAHAGMDVAIIEKDRLGGECTWWGCLPSKTLIDIARRVHQARSSDRLGVAASSIEVDFPRVMEQVRSVSREAAKAENAEALTAAGVTVYEAKASFVDPHTLTLDGEMELSADRFVIATGASPIVPDHLIAADPLTAKTIWRLEAMPERLLIAGGGPVGVEFAQAMGRLGATVELITESHRLLPRDHSRASSLIESVLSQEGIDLRTGDRVVDATSGADSVTVTLESGEKRTGTHLLVAVGTAPNTGRLGLHNAGVEIEADGSLVLDQRLRTTQTHIQAAGDVAGGRFTHIAGDQATDALRTMLWPLRKSHSGPERWATFSDPEVAQVGELAPGDAGPTQRTCVPVGRLDRALVEGATEGFLEVFHDRWGKIEGVTVVAPGASELANQWVPYIGSRMTDLLDARTIYPTLGSSHRIVSARWVEERTDRSLLAGAARSAVRLWMWARNLLARALRWRV